MDYRKDTRTPRDRVDDELLRRLLREAEEMSAKCGCMATPYSNREDRSSRCDRREENSNSCGCRREHREENDNSRGCGRERREDNDNSCGCRRERREENNNSCGCRRERREENNNSCGCRRERREENNNSCGCSHKEEKHEECSCMNHRSMSFQTQGLPLVMSYAPDQEWHELYEAEEALEMGTLFRELNFPFYHSACSKDCGCK